MAEINVGDLAASAKQDCIEICENIVCAMEIIPQEHQARSLLEERVVPAVGQVLNAVSDLLSHTDECHVRPVETCRTCCIFRISGNLSAISTQMLLTSIQTSLTRIKLYTHSLSRKQGRILHNLGGRAKGAEKAAVEASKLEAILHIYDAAIGVDDRDFDDVLRPESLPFVSSNSCFTSCEAQERLQRFLHTVACANCFAYRGFSPPFRDIKLLRNAVAMFYAPLYFFAPTSVVQHRNSVVTSNVDLQFATYVWNLPDAPLVKMPYSAVLPRIATHKEVFISPLCGGRHQLRGRLLSPFALPLQDSPPSHAPPGRRTNQGCCGLTSLLNIRWDSYSSLSASNNDRDLRPLGARARALVIHFHGGGFISMSSFSHQNYTRHWCKLTGVPLLSVDYRLAPEHPFPNPLHDCWSSYVHALERLEGDLGYIPEKIILAGDSGGGNLAIAVAMKAILEGKRVPDGLVLAYPAVHLGHHFTPSMLYALDDPLIPFSFLLACMDAYLPSRSDAVSPIPPVPRPQGHNFIQDATSRTSAAGSRTLTFSSVPCSFSPVRSQAGSDGTYSHSATGSEKDPALSDSGRDKILCSDDPSWRSSPRTLARQHRDSKIPSMELVDSPCHADGKVRGSPGRGASKDFCPPLLFTTTSVNLDADLHPSYRLNGLLRSRPTAASDECQVGELVDVSDMPQGPSLPRPSPSPSSSSSPASPPRLGSPSPQQGSCGRGGMKDATLADPQSSSPRTSLRASAAGAPPNPSPRPASRASSSSSQTFSFSAGNVSLGAPGDVVDPGENFLVSPLVAPADIFAKLPPTRMLCGSTDPLHDDCVRFAKRLSENGVDVKLEIFEDIGHGFLSFDSDVDVMGVKDVRVATTRCAEWISELVSLEFT